MTQPGSTFLGDTFFNKPLEGFNIALNGYAANEVFEEWHSHENPSISLLLNGSYQEELSKQNYQRTAGDIKFVPAGIVHRCSNYAAGTRKINVDLSPSLLSGMDISEEQLIAHTGTSFHSKFILLKIYHELNDPGYQAEASAKLLLYQLFDYQKTAQKSLTKNPPAWVNILKEYLHDEWDSKFILEVLAEKAGIHPVSLSRYFPQYFSFTLGKYINQLKIDKALSLIKNSVQSLTDIAYICGFADQAHFTRTFKQTTGYLPKDFRRI